MKHYYKCPFLVLFAINKNLYPYFNFNICYSLFMNVTKPQPRDNKDLLLVVLGGLTPAEIKFIREKEAQFKDRQVF